MNVDFPHKRMKAKSWDGKKEVTFYQPKFDGWRVTFFKDMSGDLKVFGRKTEDHLEMSADLAACASEDGAKRFFYSLRDNMPPGTSVDGELYLPKIPATSIPTYINKRSVMIHYVAFAVPYWRGQSLAETPIDKVEKLCKMELGVTFAPNYKYRGETKDQLLEKAKLFGIEGWILKRAHYADWYKIKGESTLDAIMMGKEWGRGKYEFTVGAIQVGLFRDGELVEIASVSGMDDELRSTITKDDIGRVCEIRYQEVAAAGRLRHPRFLRWRDDKPKEECTWDQLKLEEA